MAFLLLHILFQVIARLSLLLVKVLFACSSSLRILLYRQRRSSLDDENK